jgi:hypothetical protein
MQKGIGNEARNGLKQTERWRHPKRCGVGSSLDSNKKGKFGAKVIFVLGIFLVLLRVRLGLMLASGYKYKPCDNVKNSPTINTQTSPVPPFESSRVVEFFERVIQSVDLCKFWQPYLCI